MPWSPNTKGKIGWSQTVDISFESPDQCIFQHCSFFQTYEPELAVRCGNSHPFPLPDFYDHLLVVERAKPHEGEGYTWTYWPTPESGHAVVDTISESPDQVLVRPQTTNLSGMAELALCVRHRRQVDLAPAALNFSVSLAFEVFMDDYLNAIQFDQTKVSLRELSVQITPPIGCSWQMDFDHWGNQLGNIRGLKLLKKESALPDAAQTVKMLFRPRNGTVNRTKIPLMDMRFARNSDQARMYRDKDLDRPGYVFFVGDVVGSTGRKDLHHWRSVWREGVDDFERLQIDHDRVCLAYQKDKYNKGMHNRIVDRLNASLLGGFGMRGAFHCGPAYTAGPKEMNTGNNVRMGTPLEGPEFTAAFKIGDDKTRRGGLVATNDYVTLVLGKALEQPLKSMQIAGKTYQIVELDQPSVKALFAITGRAEMPFPSRLIERAIQTESRLIVGLDPELERLPTALVQKWEATRDERLLEEIIFDFNRLVIDTVKDRVAGFKPQVAFYEQYGIFGMKALERTLRYLREGGLLTILDAKRNDIESTALAYANAWLKPDRPFTGMPNTWAVDALTVNGYLGRDGIEPFLQANSVSGIFVLAKTSNASSRELQDVLTAEGQTISEKMASLAEEWGLAYGVSDGYSRVGLVVGATFPEAAAALRKTAPHCMFLMPGVGAQGGTVDAVASAAGQDGYGAFAASSRGILYGFDREKSRDAGAWTKSAGEAFSAATDKVNKQVRAALAARGV